MWKLLTNIEQVLHFWGNFFLKNSKSILKKFLTSETRNVHRLKQNFIFCLVHWKKEFNLDWYPSHAQWYQFFTRPAVRTGQLWKIPLKRASGLTTPHFAYGLQLWCSLILKLGKSIIKKNTRSNPLYPFSYKPRFLSPTCSTTQCQNLYLERP